MEPEQKQKLSFNLILMKIPKLDFNNRVCNRATNGKEIKSQNNG